ncbi:MAG: VWA domain-containing protein [Planctomycetes bacterium]|nr:VWA domain-containing protein [Planctomycetota bacterium]
MQKKHRMPNLFNIYMIDVLCCALGCIIFLWLANMREAKMIEEKLQEQTALLEDEKTKALSERDLARSNVALLGQKVMDLQGQLKADQLVMEKKDRTIKESQQQKLVYIAEIANQKKDIDLTTKRMEDTAEKLAQWVKLADLADARAKGLEKELNILKANATGLQKSLAMEIDLKKQLELKLQSKSAELTDKTKQLELTNADVVKQKKMINELASSMRDKEKKIADLDGDLKNKMVEVADLKLSMRDKEKKIADLDGDLKNKMVEVADLKVYKAKSLDLQLKLEKAEKQMQSDILALEKVRTEIKLLDMDKSTQVSALKAEIDKKNKELVDLRPWQTKYADLQAKLDKSERLLQSEKMSLEKNQREIKSLEENANSLKAKVSQLRSEVDNRFAGIELAGEKVLFLIDASGSMEMLDEKTDAPNKWNEVKATVVKILQSLPQLTKFQIIAFSDKTIFPLGAEGEWFDYSQESIALVKAGLDKVKPVGGTNMSMAFEAAFRMRSKGLDTIYLFSDGLPNLGEGLPPGISKEIKDVEKSDYLSKYVRNTMKTKWNPTKVEFPRVKINTVGFFYESPDVGAFLWALARENNGNFVGMSKP